MIVTVTPNPLLDYVIHSPHPPAEGGHRVAALDFTVGGKGINVARMLKTLGRPALAVSFAGGPNGEKIKARLRDQGVCAAFIPTRSETRAGINLVVDDPHRQTWWIEEGEELEAAEVQAMVDEVARYVKKARFLALSGTIPGRRNVNLYRRVLEECRAFPGEIYVDARGEALRQALQIGRFFLKCNRQEVMETWNYDPYREENRERFLGDARKASLTGFMITDGPGSIFWSDWTTTGWLTPPPVREVSAVGSGDAALAGLIFGRAEGRGFADAVRFAVAAGAADAGYPGPCQATWEDLERFSQSMKLVQA